MKFQTIIKHSKKMTSSKTAKRREPLGAMNLESEHINVTDSHRALQVKYSFISENKLIDPKTESEYITDKPYPDVNRLFPSKESASNVLELTKEDVFILQGVLKQFTYFKVELIDLILNQQDETYELSFNKNEQANNYLNKLTCQYNIPMKISENPLEKVTLNTKYMLDAFDFCKDDTKENNTEKYYIYLYSTNRPILISNNESFQYLILPVRT